MGALPKQPDALPPVYVAVLLIWFPKFQYSYIYYFVKSAISSRDQNPNPAAVPLSGRLLVIFNYDDWCIWGKRDFIILCRELGSCSKSFFDIMRKHRMEVRLFSTLWGGITWKPTIGRNLCSMHSCIYLINLWETSSFLRNLSLIRCGKLKSEAINKALLTSSCEETADFESKKLQPNSQCCAILDVAISMIYCWPAGIKFGMQNGCEI